MFRSSATRRGAGFVAAWVSVAVVATTLAGPVVAVEGPAPAAQAATSVAGSPDPAVLGRIGPHGSAVAPDWASVTVQLTANHPAQLAALARDRVRTGPARRAELLAAVPSAATATAVVRFLSRAGLTITGQNRFGLTAAGPKDLVQSLFPAPARTSRARNAAAAASPLTVPPALAGMASFVVGGAHTPRVVYPRYATATAAAARPSFTLAPVTGTTVRSLYDVPAAATSAPAQGITVATLQFSGWDNRNLTSFAAANHLPDPVASAQYQEVSVDGANPRTPDGNGGDIEVALDQEALLTTAPRANQVAYFAPNTTQGFVDGINAVAADALAQRAGHLFTALSVSWGQCEPYWSPNDMLAIHTALQNAVAAGVTVFAAAGDAGAYDCSTPNVPNNTLAVDFPASDPFVIGVGGLSTDPVARQERTWWTAQGPAPGYLGSGGGGGRSGFWPAPSWQAGLPPGPPGRLVPDMSLDADPGSGLNIVAQGQSLLVGGTSLAAPLAAATMTDLQIANGASNSYGLGNISGALYGSPATSWRDTTAGTNGYYAAVAGFDLASGRGAPLWSHLRSAILAGAAGPNSFHPSAPECRLLDTRTGSSTCAGAGPNTAAPLGPGRALRVPVNGVAGVPGNATAVVLNLTAVGATAATFVTAWPTGTARPSTSTLNAAPGSAVPNLAVVPVGADGSVSLYNANGQIQLVVDLVGWFGPGPGSGYTSATPCRVLDTRYGRGTCSGAAVTAPAPLPRAGTLRVRVGGVGTIPVNATAVVLNLTAVGATARTWLTAWADYAPRPNTSNLNPTPGQGPEPNLAVVPVGADGYIDIYNADGDVHLVVDAVGWFAPGTGAGYTPTRACRVLDTRNGSSTCPGAGPLRRGPLGPGQTLRVRVLSGAGIPAAAKGGAVALNLTAVGATAGTWLTVWADGTPRPATSNLNPAPNQVPRPNVAVVPVPASGYIDVYNAGGRVNLIIDSVGWFGPP